MQSPDTTNIGRLLEAEVLHGRLTSAFALWSNEGQALRSVGVGCGTSLDGSESESARSVPPDEESLFDLASLTKPVVATVALWLDQSGRLPLATPLGEVLPAVRPELATKSLEDLLRHRAGLVPWYPLYALAVTPEEAYRWLASEAPVGARRGTYSDLGYLLYAWAVKSALGPSLEELLAESKLLPEGQWNTGRASGAVPCELGNRREVELAAALGQRIPLVVTPPKGQPQDGNARFLGGCTGHAGLFASAKALLALGRCWLGSGLLSPDTLRAALVGPRRFPVGWRRRTLRGSGGRALSEQSFGHIGFTGGSLWIDPEAAGVRLLLAHRSRVDVELAGVRRRFHRLAVSSN